MVRQVAAWVFALLVLGVTALGAQRVLTDGFGSDGGEDASVAAEAWATAIEQLDLESIGERVTSRTDPELLAGVHVMFGELLGDRPRDVTVGPVTSDDGEGEAVVTLSTAVEVVPGGQPWVWESELVLERSGGQWEVPWTPAMLHPDLRAGWVLELRTSDPVRAPILDRRGRALSGTAEVVEIGVEPGRLPDTERLVTVVGRVLPTALDSLLALLADEDTVPDWYYPLVVVDADAADAAWADLIGVPGFIRRDDEGGVGPAPYAPDLVGGTTLVDGLPRGVGGLQEALDGRLSGSELASVVLVDSEGRDREVLHEAQADPSPPLVTTIDRDVQQALQDALLTVDDPLGIVAIDVATGGVVGTLSRPDTGFARALEGSYPPGTLAGIVTVAAALEGGAAPDRPVECPQSTVAGGVTVSTGTGGGGTRTLTGALSPGCATGLATLSEDLDGEAFDAAAALLGLAVEPSLAVAAAGWDAPTPGTDAAVASAAVGHARVQTSALSAAALIGTVARGAPVAPVVVADDVPAPGTALPTGVAVPLRQALVAAAADGLVSVDGLTLAGMTGRTGLVRGDPAPATGWWAGWILEGGPEIALAIVVEGDDGSRAAQLARRVLSELAGE